MSEKDKKRFKSALLLQVAPSLLLFLGVIGGSAQLELMALVLFGVLAFVNYVSFVFYRSFVNYLIKVNYTPAMPVFWMKGFDVVAIAALAYSNHIVFTLIFTVSCALSWTVYERYERVKELLPKSIVEYLKKSSEKRKDE